MMPRRVGVDAIAVHVSAARSNSEMERPMRPLQLVEVLEYLCLGIHIDRSHDGRVSCISGHSWLGTGFWLGWRMRAISKVFARHMLRLRQAYFASRREAAAVIGIQYRLPPYPRSN